MDTERELDVCANHSPIATADEWGSLQAKQAGAVLVAAGSGQRMGNVDKATLPLHGRAVLDWVLDAFAQMPRIGPIAVVAGVHNHEALRQLLASRRRGNYRIVEGGNCRARSVANGVAALVEVELIVIHDVARPLVTPELIEQGLVLAEQCGGAIAVAPVSDTIKQVDDAENIVRTVERRALRAAQTPQIFRLDWLRDAYDRFGPELETMTDEAMLLERAGYTVATYAGLPENIKLTVPADLVLAETLLARREKPANR